MSEGQIRRTEQPTVAFVLSLLAGLWMLAAGSMMGGFGWGGMTGGWMGAELAFAASVCGGHGSASSPESSCSSARSCFTSNPNSAGAGA